MSDRGKTETDNERGEIGRWRKVKHKAKYKMGGLVGWEAKGGIYRGVMMIEVGGNKGENYGGG